MAQHAVVGKPAPRLDIPAKVTGAPAYVHDLDLPGMLHGRIVRPPGPGAVLVAFDEAGVRALTGVVAVVRDGSFLGVVAEREEQAIRALARARRSAEWRETASLPGPDPRYLLTAEAKSIPLIHEMARQSVHELALLLHGRPEAEELALAELLHTAVKAGRTTRLDPVHLHARQPAIIARLENGRFEEIKRLPVMRADPYLTQRSQPLHPGVHLKVVS